NEWSQRNSKLESALEWKCYFDKSLVTKETNESKQRGRDTKMEEKERGLELLSMDVTIMKHGNRQPVYANTKSPLLYFEGDKNCAAHQGNASELDVNKKLALGRCLLLLRRVLDLGRSHQTRNTLNPPSDHDSFVVTSIFKFASSLCFTIS
ncbi:hypothetical protein C0J52_27111, partial [Blattella germanica]